MSRRPPIHPLLRALQVALPDATLTLLRCRDWYSMTYSGERAEFSVRLKGEDAQARLEALARQLPEREFALPGRIVADIIVIGIEGATAFAEALLLDDA